MKVVFVQPKPAFKNIIGQYLTGSIGPDAARIALDEYAQDLNSARCGDIIINRPEEIPKLHSAVLDGLIYIFK